jgi:hypothetical protein
MMLRAVRAWPALLLLALLHAGITPAQNTPQDPATADPKSVIRDCSIRIDGRPTGLSELETACPQLRTALIQAQLRPLIIDSSRARLDRRSLFQLQRLLHASSGPAPAVAALAPILRGLTVTSVAPHSCWRRLWDWLVDHLGPQQTTSDPWLAELMRLAVRARWLWTAVIWFTLIALPVAVGIILRREVRAMGRRSTDDPALTGAPQASGLSQSRLALLRAAPLEQRPALLFAMLIRRLVASERLPADRSLTHREIARMALLDDADQRRLIESLARQSERQLYAGARGAPEGLAELLAQAEDLYLTGWSRPRDIHK